MSKKHLPPPEAATAPVEGAKPKKQKKPMSVLGLIVRCLLLIVTPWAFVMLSGLILDMWLKLYDAVPYIFYTFILLCIVDFFHIIHFIVAFILRRRRAGATKSK